MLEKDEVRRRRKRRRRTEEPVRVRFSSSSSSRVLLERVITETNLSTKIPASFTTISLSSLVKFRTFRILSPLPLDFFISLVPQAVQNLWKLSSGERGKRHKLPVDVRKTMFRSDVERLFYALDGVVVDDVPPIGGGVVRRRKGRKRRRRFGGDDHLLLSLIRLAPREESFDDGCWWIIRVDEPSLHHSSLFFCEEEKDDDAFLCVSSN